MPPIWRKAPLLLFRFPGLLIPIAAAVAVLTLGAASQPLFVSSAASATLEREFAQLDANTIGLQIGTYGIPLPQTLQRAEDEVNAQAERVPRLGDARLQLLGENVTVGDDEARLPVMFRTGALDNIIVAEEAGGEGVWIAASIAERFGLAAGDELTVHYGGQPASVPIAGIYTDIADVLTIATYRPPDPLPPDHPVVEYWGPLGGLIIQTTPQGPSVQPPPILADKATMTELVRTLELPTRIEWTFPYDVANPSLESLKASLGPLRMLEGRANDPLDPLGESLRAVHLYGGRIPVQTFLPGVAERVTAAVQSLSAPVRALSLAAQGLALLVVAVAAAFGAQRRSVELRLLVVQGMPTLVQGARAAVEAVLPSLIGAVAGWTAAVALVRVIGPSPDIAPEVINAALVQSLLLTLVPILLIGAVTAAVARSQAQQGSSRLRGVAARAPWEVVVLVLAGAAYFQAVSSGAPTGEESGLNGMVLLFPLLLIAGGAGLIARALARLLPKLRGAARRSNPATYLARRRLAAAPGSALLLVAASSLAIGVLVYAATAASTTNNNLTMKAAVNVGSDVAVDLGQYPQLDVPFESTYVGRQEADLLGGVAGEQTVDVLAIDPATFPSAATWSGSFADRSLGDLVSDLGHDGERMVVLAVGGSVPPEATLATSRYEMPIRVAERVRGFPGMSVERPLIVVAREPFLDTVAKTGTSSVKEHLLLEGEQWIRGEPGRVAAALERLGVEEEDVTTVAALRSRPDLLARSWALAYLQAVGLVAGLLAFIGTLLYLSARQASREVAYVLARRMGLSAPSHRRSVAVELAGMLGIATVTGTLLAILAARLLLVQLNPLPELAPAPTLVVPTRLLLAVAAAIIVACAVGAAVVQRSADRAKVSEVLRLAA